MMKYLILSCLLLFLIKVNATQNKGYISIPLLRQKSPRVVALNIDNIEQHGLWLDWLKPQRKPNPEPRTNDSIALHRYLDSEFYATIVVGGRKGKSFNVLVDTTWSTSWLMSKECYNTKTPGCWFHQKYNHNLSSSYVADGTPFLSKEGSYNLTGYYSYDTFYIEHSNVTSQSFVEMTSVPPIQMLSKADGLLGLAMKYGDKNPFFYNLMEQGKIKQPVFSIFLNRDKQSEERGGNIFLGGYEQKHIHVTNKKFDPMTEVKVDSKYGYWEFNIDRVLVEVNKTTFPLCTDNCKAMVDSSSNAIYASRKEVDKINNYIGATPLYFGYYQVDCDLIMKKPPIHFVLNGNLFTLTGKQYIQKVSYGFLTACISAFRATNAPAADKKWILGGAFLAEYYSIYDIKERTINFVKAA